MMREMGEPSQPRTFGAYTVDRELGRGGMGVVYAATHDVLGKRAAIKVLQTEASRDDHAVERFVNEARAASAIDHPSIVEVYDVGRVDGTVYILMELLSGESLATRLKTRGAMPIGIAVGIARQCANALEAAHRANIVHRDLKPDNVFLVPDAEVPGGERVKLLDFGVAKLVGADNGGSTQRTITGAILGTPQYMSPEQCEGAREVDQRSDLYSLGCMLFQMVAGRLPFHSQGIGGMIGMHLYVEPPLLRSVRPDAPVELEALISRLLAKAPDARVQTAAEVATLLSAIPVDLTESMRSRASAPELSRPRVDGAMPTMASVDVNPFAATPLPTSRAAIEKAGRKRRWLWIGLAGVVAAAAIAIVVIAISKTDDTPDARTEIVARPPKPAPAPTPPGPTPPAPTPEPTPTDRDLAEAKQMLADKKNLDGAYARTLIVLERSPTDPEALKLKAEIRRARANEAIEALHGPGRRPDEVKRSRDVVYANTDDGDALRAEADRAWAKVKPVPRPTTPPPQVVTVPKKEPEKQEPSKEDIRKKRADEFLHLINNSMGNATLMSMNCRNLAYVAPERVPWHACISAACSINFALADGMIMMAPVHDRIALRKLCPAPTAPR